ncbi:MAG: PAS domain S-box protein [Polymorphobacter sp.]
MSSDPDSSVRHGEDELARLAALAALDVLDSPAEREFDTIAELAADRFDVPIALVSLVASERQWFKARFGLDIAETARDVSFCTHAIGGDEVLVVADARLDPRFAANPLVTGEPYIRFYAGAPLILASGQRIGTLCIIDRRRRDFDLRERRALKLMAQQVVDLLELRRLRHSQQISQIISETTSDAFVCTDGDSQVIYWNRAAEQMFGWTAREALGTNLDIIIPDRHRRAHHGGMSHVRTTWQSRLVGRMVEVPALRRDGSEFPVELSLGMWKAGDDHNPTGFTAIIRDASQRKQLEAERDTTRERLAEQVDAIEVSNDGVAITDTVGQFIYMNRSHAEMFGYPDAAALIGMHWSDLYTLEARERLEAEAFPVIAAEGRWRGESIGVRRDGSAIRQEISLSLRSDGGLVCVTRDVGERHRSEREMARLREQLLVSQRQEIVGQIASGIAHDFNNLIAAISGSAALIVADPSNGARRQAERIETAAANAASLVAKMLSLGTRTPDNREIDLAAKIRSVVELLRASLAAQHSIVLYLPDEPISLIADSTEVMQVLLNLLVNARDAMDPDQPGQIIVRLERLLPGDAAARPVIGRRPRGPAALVRVEDTGSGIAEQALAGIFEPFRSGKGRSGSGLGLAVVKSIVEAAGGGVTVDSHPGEGARFDVFWPLDPPKPSLLPAMRSIPVSNNVLKGRAVLVVDDNPAVVDVLTELLEGAGAEVGPCLEAQDALAAIDEDPDAWALLITDYDMPGTNGAELAALARQLKPDLPVLLCTALPEQHRRQNPALHSFDAIIGKPVSLDSLLAGAEAAIEACAARKAR